MRLLVLTAAIAALGTVAHADTIQEMINKGVVITAPGFEVEVVYTPDGKFTAAEGQVTGTWRIDGEKLCTTSNFEPAEQCLEYPKDKKSGDSFEVTGPAGTATIKIK